MGVVVDIGVFAVVVIDIVVGVGVAVRVGVVGVFAAPETKELR